MKSPILPALLFLFSWALTSQASNPQAPLLSPSSPVTQSSPLLSLHRSLIELKSLTFSEYPAASFLTKYLKSHGMTVEKQVVTAATPSSDSRQNVLAYFGDKRETRVLVSSHIDTVPPFWPYERKGEHGEEIWGRGSVDAKGSVAAQITALLELRAAGKIEDGDVGLLFVVGEEVGGDGMKAANDLDISWEAVIFGEPTELKLASGHKGILGFEVKAKGKAGHSGYPELGRNANSMLVGLLARLEKVEWPRSEKYGLTTFNIGEIGGGVASNVIAEEAFAKLAIRIADGGPEVVKQLVLDAVKATGEEFELHFSAGYGPVYIDSDVPGFDTLVVNYGTDIPNLKGDHKRYLYGPGSILVAHSDHEHLTVTDLETSVEGYKKLIQHSLK